MIKKEVSKQKPVNTERSSFFFSAMWSVQYQKIRKLSSMKSKLIIFQTSFVKVNSLNWRLKRMSLVPVQNWFIFIFGFLFIDRFLENVKFKIQIANFCNIKFFWSFKCWFFQALNKNKMNFFIYHNRFDLEVEKMNKK